MSLQSLVAPTRHRPWCDVDSHDGYAATYDADAGCTSPVRVEVIGGRHRVAGFVEDTGRGPVVRLVDAPVHEPLSPAAAARLARAVEGLAAVAAGDVPASDRAGDRAGGRVGDALALFRHYASRTPATERAAVLGSLVAVYAAGTGDDAELGGIVRALVDAADVEWSTEAAGAVRSAGTSPRCDRCQHTITGPAWVYVHAPQWRVCQVCVDTHPDLAESGEIRPGAVR